MPLVVSSLTCKLCQLVITRTLISANLLIFASKQGHIWSSQNSGGCVTWLDLEGWADEEVQSVEASIITLFFFPDKSTNWSPFVYTWKRLSDAPAFIYSECEDIKHTCCSCQKYYYIPARECKDFTLWTLWTSKVVVNPCFSQQFGVDSFATFPWVGLLDLRLSIS